MWYEERTIKSRHATNPKFSLCCSEGKVQIPLLRQPPVFLQNLLDQCDCNFMDNIRTYNSMFPFTSMGGRIDNEINNGGGPCVFRLNGSNYHCIGSLYRPRVQSHVFHNFMFMIQKMKYLTG